MNARYRRSLAFGAGLAIALTAANALAGASAMAQEASGQPSGRPVGPPMAPADVKPETLRYGDPQHADLSGVWLTPLGVGYGVDIPVTKAYQAILDAHRRAAESGAPVSDSVTRCIALGMPRFMTLQFEAIQTPGQLTMVSGTLTDVRRIYIDPRGHSPDAEPSYNGDSVGHWEGDTLVVETNNLVPGVMGENGVSYSDKLVITERFHRTAPNRMEVVTTMTDPEAFTHPWTYTKQYSLLAPGSRIEEYRCENNRNDNGSGSQVVLPEGEGKK